MFLDPGQRQPDLSVVQTIILRQCYLGLKPELRFPIRALHMNMAAKLLAGEKVESETSRPKDRGAHRTGSRDPELGRLVSIQGHNL
jgi:hypothetical protein